MLWTGAHLETKRNLILPLRAGPVLGGAFAFPCESFGPSFPLCGEGQLFRAREFLLPCLVTSVLSLLSSLSSALVLPETLPKLVRARRAREKARVWARRSSAGGAGAEEQKIGAPEASVNGGSPSRGEALQSALPCPT